MEVIPAIDLLDGKAVRLTKGRFEDVTVYSEAPAELAASWRGLAPRLHVVDLDGSREGRAAQGELVRAVVSAFGPGVQVGGGVRTFEAIESYLALGVDRVVLGSAALRDPAMVRRAAEAYPERIILAVDARGGYVATEGWLEQSQTRAIDLVRQFEGAPLAAVLYTDIERDGTQVGPNVAETARLAAEGGVPVIASGGVGTLEHLEQLSREPGIVAAIVGRALHEGNFTVLEAVRAGRGAGLPG